MTNALEKFKALQATEQDEIARRKAVHRKMHLRLNHDIWVNMTTAQKQYHQERYIVTVTPSFAPADDLDQLREMAPVARCEVA